MALDIMKEKGTPLDRQRFDWRDLTREPISKLNDDAFTRVRIILMNGIELQTVRMSHMFARMNRELRPELAALRRVDHHQQTLINWLIGPDHSPLETTIAYEQVAIEVTASIAMNEPDPYMAQAHRFGLLEDFDHLYRYSALLERLEGKDPNNILQCYTDVRPGRPTHVHHRAPVDDLNRPYDRKTAHPLSKLNAMTLVGGEQQTRDYYMNVGPLFADPVARALYAEIASVEEQHVTHYESLLDPDETMLEKWLLTEACEAYNYMSCVAYESNPRIKQIWERFLDYELGQLHFVMDLFRKIEKRDPLEVLPAELPEPIKYESHRAFITEVLESEVDLQACGTDYMKVGELPADWPSQAYREQLNSKGVPSDVVSAGYMWQPGTELVRAAAEHPPKNGRNGKSGGRNGNGRAKR